MEACRALALPLDCMNSLALSIPGSPVGTFMTAVCISNQDRVCQTSRGERSGCWKGSQRTGWPWQQHGASPGLCEALGPVVRVHRPDTTLWP